MFRFDEEVSRQISDFGSRLKLSPPIAEGSPARVQVMHLPPAGRVGPHQATVQQLFAVVSGSGWVSGAEGRRRNLGVGYAALWDEGEDHEAGSEAGLMAICIEGNFEVRALAVTREIRVSDYDPAWPGWFEQVRARVWPAIQDVALRIDHVGSTSVSGLAAKPIIDMDIVVASEDEVHPVIERLARAGYQWRGDLGVAGREAFRPEIDEGLPPHHLYLVVENNRAHMDHWLLRDLLRADGEAREGYAALKRQNVELAAGDIDVYVAGKATLVAELLARARAERGLSPVEYWTPDRPDLG